jgi:hypothetical protein
MARPDFTPAARDLLAAVRRGDVRKEAGSWWRQDTGWCVNWAMRQLLITGLAEMGETSRCGVTMSVLTEAGNRALDGAA